MIDHTLVDSYLSSLQSAQSAQTSKSEGLPSYAALEDAITKVQTVNKQYIFSTNSSTAVLTNPQFIAKETSGGRSLDHYKVGYNKNNLSAYIGAVGQALDSSQLNTWYKSVSSNKNVSDALNISSLQSKVKSASGNYTFDLWADTKTKLVAKVSFTDPSNKSSVFSIQQNYTSGSTYPFVFGFIGKDSSGNPEAASLSFSIDTTTNKANLSFTGNSTSSSGMTNITGNISMTPSNASVNVTAPKNAESITNLLLSLGLGSSASGTLNTTGISQSTVNPLAITE